MKGNIFLIGFSGIGKSTVGLAYAKANKKNFVSQDYIVEKILGMPIKDYQKKYGATKTKMAFSNILKELIMSCSNTIIDCGGGISDTIDLHNQTVLHLSTSPEVIQERYKIEDKNDKNRFAKFLDEDEFLRIFNKKEIEYKKFANYTVFIEKDDSIDDVVFKIEKLNLD